MPELPEVDEVRRGLAPFVVGVEVVGVEVRRGDFVWPRGERLKGLVGERVGRVLRHGKKLFVVMEGGGGGGGKTVLIHLGMSGRVDCVEAGAEILKHTHVIFSLRGGKEVRLRDPRRFGGVWFYGSFAEASRREIATIGPDALELKAEDLAGWRGGQGGRGGLKQRLLSQRDVAGLGNIYVDEALWMARLHPLQRVGRIEAGRVEELVRCVREVLRKAIASGGTTLRDYRNVADQPGEFARQLKAYGRAGEACLRCGEEMKGIRVAGRMTVFCAMCQKRS